jgi:trimeric autotransporter adhesin
MKQIGNTILTIASITASCVLFANPTNPVVIDGDVTITNPDDATILITSNSERTIIEWDTFSNDYGEFINFQLPDENSYVLNRVTGSGDTTLAGLTRSNGNVYVINENGLTTGPYSEYYCNGFLASTLNASNSEFLAGGDMTFAGTSNTTLSHSGFILNSGGDAILLGYQVFHDSNITASGGVAALGAGQQIILHPTGSERITVVSQGTQPSQAGIGIEYASTSVAISRQQEFKADGVFFDTGIFHEGYSDIRGDMNKNGYVNVSSENGVIHLNGSITNRNFDNSGGNIDIFGLTINMDVSSYVDASGFTGGGNINIGSEFGGTGAPFNATTITMASSSFVTADAGIFNDGGQIVVWSDDSTTFLGFITSRGGNSSGNGGLIEVSGVNFLDFSGFIDNSCPHGITGALLLDPEVLKYSPKDAE